MCYIGVSFASVNRDVRRGGWWVYLSVSVLRRTLHEDIGVFLADVGHFLAPASLRFRPQTLPLLFPQRVSLLLHPPVLPTWREATRRTEETDDEE
jgi:hypothetical protein